MSWRLVSFGSTVFLVSTLDSDSVYIRAVLLWIRLAKVTTLGCWQKSNALSVLLGPQDRVATMNENIPITQHQAILREKLSESEARAVALRQEL